MKNPNLNISINLIIRATEKLAIERDILQHKVQQLLGTFINKKKRRRRGKNMRLFAKDELGQAIFFFLDKIAIVRARQEKLNTQKK